MQATGGKGQHYGGMWAQVAKHEGDPLTLASQLFKRARINSTGNEVYGYAWGVNHTYMIVDHAKSPKVDFNKSVRLYVFMVDIMVLLENSLHPNIASNRGINLKIVEEEA